MVATLLCIQTVASWDSPTATPNRGKNFKRMSTGLSHVDYIVEYKFIKLYFPKLNGIHWLATVNLNTERMKGRNNKSILLYSQKLHVILPTLYVL